MKPRKPTASHHPRPSGEATYPANPTPFAEAHADGVLLRIRVQPRAARTAIEGPLGDELKIRIAAPPVDDAANQALHRFLADCFDCPRGRVQLVRGHKSRSKVVVVFGVSLDAVAAALAVQ